MTGPTLTDSATGITFEAAIKLWNGSDLTCLGAGHRALKVMLIPIKPYAIALYVTPSAARGSKSLTEFDSLASCQAIVMELTRNVDGKNFLDQLQQNLVPRMKGEETAVEELKNFFLNCKPCKHCRVIMLFDKATFQSVVLPPDTPTADWAAAKPGCTIQSPRLCRELFTLYVDDKSVVPNAVKIWTEGLRSL